jgi:hypothetical protein
MAAPKIQEEGLGSLVIGEDCREDLWSVRGPEGGIARRAEGRFPGEEVSCE